MPIRDELERRRHAVMDRLQPEDRSTIQATVEQLRLQQLAEHSLQIGDPFPDFALPDAKGGTVKSDDLLDRGPMIVAFFRGGWCPYCELALATLEAAHTEVERLGATVVGVSLLRPSTLARLAEERGLGFLLLSDRAGHLARLCGICYRLPEAHRALLLRQGIDLDQLQGEGGWQLALPATYVVGRDASVRFAFIDPDWTRRAEPEDFLDALRTECQAAALATVG
jgi:peroxiredoxin